MSHRSSAALLAAVLLAAAFCVSAAPPLAAAAGNPGEADQAASAPVASDPVADPDYATQWPLVLRSDNAGAYRVVLDEPVYRQLTTPAMRDLDVLNAAGATVPAAVLDPAQPLAQPVRRAGLPWFALPAPAAGARPGGDWRLVTRVDSDGRLRRVEVDGRTSPAGSARTALLLDLSRVREPVVALELQWKPVDALDLGYTVEASDDLSNWREVPARGRLVDLSRDGRRLLHRRIQLYGLLPHHQRARYLRLTPDATPAGFEVTSVTAEFAGAATQAPQWLALQPSAAPDAAAAGAPTSIAFEYRMPGPFPVQQVDVAMAGNHAHAWRLESRDSAQSEWRLRAGPWTAYQLDQAGQRRQSPPRVLDAPVRDRHWRLSASGPAAGAPPTLRLGYRPEVVVFVAQGAPPYRLVAGSARERRADAPMAELVTALREYNGADWQPAQAYLGPPRVLAGPAALAPRRDWTAWLLWGVLLLGAGLVAVLAVSVLRSQCGTGRD